MLYIRQNCFLLCKIKRNLQEKQILINCHQLLASEFLGQSITLPDHVCQPLLHSAGVDEQQGVIDEEIHSEGGRLEVPLLLAAVHKGDGDSFHLD